MSKMKRAWLVPVMSGLAAIIGILTVDGCNSGAPSATNLPKKEKTETVEAAPQADPVIVYQGEPDLKGIKPDKPVIIDFSATWCGPCRMFAPIYHEVAEKMADKATFYSVDVDRNPSLARYYGASAIPYVVVVNTDGSVTTSVGLIEAPELEQLILSAK